MGIMRSIDAKNHIYAAGMVLFCMLSVVSVVAQDASEVFVPQKNSIFYLRNGSVYIGSVLNDEREMLEVALYDGTPISFSRFSIRRYLPAKNIKVHFDGRYNVIRGFFFQTGLGVNAGSIFETNDQRISSHNPYIFGWHFNSRIAGGAGFGFEFDEAEIGNFFVSTQLTSLFIYGRYYLTEQKRRPFLYARVGGAFSSFDDEIAAATGSGGFQFQAGGGLHFSSRKSRKFILSLGYHQQKAAGQDRFIDFAGSEVIVDYDLWIRRLVLTFGIEFNYRHRGYQR